MILIAAGVYPMGSADGPSDKQPPHTVRLEAFSIDRHEVTNAQFAQFLQAVGAALLMENTGQPDRRTLVALNDDESRIGIRDGRLVVQAGFEDHPVNEVSWNGARDYCAWRGARLPTEAEWETAARGAAGRIHPWGAEPPSAGRAVFGRRSNQTEAVGKRPAGATPQGVHDLAGNVAEWTSTLYRPYPYRADDGREDPAAPGERVTRGGDHVYDSTPEKLRAPFRGGFSRAPRVAHRHIGFRCASG